MYKITYSTRSAGACTKLNHLLFGRVDRQRHKGVTYSYYRPGLLHDIRHIAIRDGTYILEKYDPVVFCRVQEFADVWEVTEGDFLSGRRVRQMRTGHQKWRRLADERRIKNIKWGKHGSWTLPEEDPQVDEDERY